MTRLGVTKSQRGATLLEALLATSIASVLASTALPALSKAMAHQQIGAVSADLFTTFSLARSEAVRRGSAVAVIPADANDWSSGWKVFADLNDNGVQDSGEPAIVERQPSMVGLSIQPFFGATLSGKVLSYDAEGRLHRPGKDRLVIGRLVVARDGLARSLCFASLGVRMVAAATCE